MAKEWNGGNATNFDGNPVLAEVAGWPGISIHSGSRGETSVRLGRVEIGHMHGARVAHFGFPKALWAELLREGIVDRHPIDQPGWAARLIRTDEDVTEVVDLFRLNYERILERAGGKASGDEGTGQGIGRAGPTVDGVLADR